MDNRYDFVGNAFIRSEKICRERIYPFRKNGFKDKNGTAEGVPYISSPNEKYLIKEK